MWGFDKEELIKLIAVLIFVGVWIMNVLFRALGKASRKVEEARRRGETRAPVKDIREFLKEIRGEAPAAPAARPPAEARHHRQEGGERARERREAPPWREAASRGRRTAPPAPEPTAAEARTIPREPIAPEQPRKSVHEYLEEAARQAASAEEAELAGMLAAEAGAPESPETGRRPLSALEESLARKFGEAHTVEESPAPAAVRAEVLPGGFTLRQAVLAQTILGPPRARQVRSGPRSRRS
jgi:chemotaxis protein histidine kinase CheA